MTPVRTLLTPICCPISCQYAPTPVTVAALSPWYAVASESREAEGWTLGAYLWGGWFWGPWSPVIDSICQATLSKALCLNVFATGTLPGARQVLPRSMGPRQRSCACHDPQTQGGEPPGSRFDSILVTEGDSEMFWDERTITPAGSSCRWRRDGDRVGVCVLTMFPGIVQGGVRGDKCKPNLQTLFLTPVSMMASSFFWLFWGCHFKLQE